MNIEQTIQTLQDLLSNADKLAELSESQRIALMKAAGELTRPDKSSLKLRQRAIRKALEKKKSVADRNARAQTGIRRARENQVFSAPPQIAEHTTADFVEELISPRNCYVCKTEFTRLHFFYDSMCPACAQLNYAKRYQTVDLSGQVAVITGARLKIGYHVALMLLRAGAQVIVTTRFPVDAAIRYAKEADYAAWSDRLEIYGLDLRHTPSVEIFCRYLKQKLSRLDILINNAAQTVRRPPGFYAHLIENERKNFEQLESPVQKILNNYNLFKNDLHTLSSENLNTTDGQLTCTWHDQGVGVGIRAAAELSQIPYSFDRALQVQEVFPEGQLDADLQQVDLRKTNSWRLKLAEVPAAEMFEVQLVNSIAPFVLCSQLLPLMRRELTGQKHIVNVTAMEGKFYRFKKEDRHPHTNMAKAALNMMTHTAAADLEKDGIFINAVDTGWVTDEDPAQLAEFKKNVHDFQPPLDIVDGAARICDPIFDGIKTGRHWSGQFLKDYFPIDW